jgi:hypothetical protein
MIHMDGYVVVVKDLHTGQLDGTPFFTTNLGSARKSAKQRAVKHAAEVYVFEIGKAIFLFDEKGKEHDLADSK